MWDKAQVITSSVSGVDRLTPDNVQQIMAVLGDVNATKVVVTDGAGDYLYDSSPQTDHNLRLQQIEEALSGQDVFFCHYGLSLLESHAAVPIMQNGLPIGCVYIYDCDKEQGTIIHALEGNILRISIAVEVLLLVFSAGFALKSSKKMRTILDSVQRAREGDYQNKAQVGGTDEYALLADDFNRLTDRLQMSEQAQRQFVSDASHELKTPLASIKLLADSVMQNEMDIETMREFVSDIGNEADRLTRLTQKLLAISKAESISQEHEIVDLAHVISKVYKMLVSLADVRGIRLTCNMARDCTVLTVEDDMYQIFFNLVENAIKYNKEDGLVHVDLRREGDDIVANVEDTGIGIPETELEKVFERFYRLDKARSRAEGGSGLGLSIVQELVHRNYGEISVTRREVGGTCFTVTFPCFDVDQSE